MTLCLTQYLHIYRMFIDDTLFDPVLTLNGLYSL